MVHPITHSSNPIGEEGAYVAFAQSEKHNLSKKPILPLSSVRCMYNNLRNCEEDLLAKVTCLIYAF